MARSRGSVSARRCAPLRNIVADRTNRLNRSFISSPVIRPRLDRDAQIVCAKREPGGEFGRYHSNPAGSRKRRPCSRSDPLQRLACGFVVTCQSQGRPIFASGAGVVALFFKQLAEKIMSFESGSLLDRAFGKITAQQLD